MIKAFQALRHWLDENNFPEHEQVDVTISVKSLEGISRLHGALERECAIYGATGVTNPVRANGTFSFEICGIPADVTYREAPEGLGQLAHDILNIDRGPTFETYVDEQGVSRVRRVPLQGGYRSLYKDVLKSST